MEAKSKRISPIFRAAGLLALLLIAALLLNLLLVDYRASLALLGGALGAAVVLAVLRFLTTWRRRLLALGFLGLVAAVLCLVVVLSSGLGLTGAAAGEPLDPFEIPSGEASAGDEPAAVPEAPSRVAAITGYHMIIQPDEDLSAFVIEEEVIFDVYEGAQVVAESQVQAFPRREVERARRGFLLWEVDVEVLDGNAARRIALREASGGVYESPFCSGSLCPASVIELRDFPQGAFHAARDTTRLNSTPFLNTETLEWSVNDLRRPVAFAFVAPPFSVIKPVLAPLLGASNLAEWMVALIGMLGTVIFFPLVRAFVDDWLQGLMVSGTKKVVREGRKVLPKHRTHPPGNQPSDGHLAGTPPPDVHPPADDPPVSPG